MPRAHLGQRLARAALAGAVCACVFAPAASAHPPPSELVAALDAELARRPTDPALWLARAHVGRDLGLPAQALADLERAASSGAEPAEVELVRALVALDAGDAATAEHALDRSLALRPGHAQTLVTRGRARRLAGRFDAAAADFAAVRHAAARPDPGWIDEEVALLRAAGRAAAALAVLAEAAEKLGPLPGLVDSAVELELAAGRGDAALAWLDRGLAYGDRATGLARRAELELVLGRDAAAADDFEAAWAALRERPPHRRATRGLAALETRLRRVLVELGRPDPGVALCLPAAPTTRSLR